VTERPSWDETYSEIAKIVSQRATCSRRKVGAVIVQDNVIVSTGYNGVASGKTHCTEGGCPRGKFSHDEIPKDADYNAFPCRAVHAEANAISRIGYAACKGGTLYVTEEPCQQCWNSIEAAGIGRLVIVDGTHYGFYPHRDVPDRGQDDLHD